MNNLAGRKPNLYFDVDGVVVPFLESPGSMNAVSKASASAELPFEMAALNRLESYAPEVVRRLGDTGLNVIWCTTQAQLTLDELTGQIGSWSDSRRLDLPHADDVDTPRIDLKLGAIIADQEQYPTPLVWADDEITAEVRVRAETAFGDRPHLIIQPNRYTGINNEELTAIEEFAKTCAEARAKACAYATGFTAGFAAKHGADYS